MYKLIFKRLLDFLLSLIGLIVLSPIFIVLMIVGHIKMKGNPFFFQERPGKNGKIFKFIKFRSMSEEKDKNGNYLPDEKRLTEYGKWLRRTSIDELPELINIVKGDMSIVGPRPLLVQYLPLYNEEQKHRHDVLPGLTGLAQVNGRANLSWQDKFKYDVEYVNNVSFINDLKIILKTIKVVFSEEDIENEEKGTWYPFLGNDKEDQLTPILKEKHKEIGSEFVDIPLLKKKNNTFPKDTVWFNSGREALSFIIDDILNNKNIKTVAVPSWCCESMIKPFIDRGLKTVFYSTINKNGFKKIKNIKADVLLNMNYFGCENEIIKFKGIIINDVTHSIFMKNNNFIGNYVFGSLRKWAGFKTGGLAYCEKGFNIDKPTEINKDYILLKEKAINMKRDYLNGLSTNKSYLDVFSKAEEMLNTNNIFLGYDNDINSANHLNVKFIQETRRKNAKELLKTVKKYAVFKTVKENDCPLFVPIIVPNEKRDELRQRLIENKIYCPIHWPISDLHKLTKEEKYIYENELSLVCDQRYTIDDMKKISSIITNFFNEDTEC